MGKSHAKTCKKIPFYKKLRIKNVFVQGLFFGLLSAIK